MPPDGHAEEVRKWNPSRNRGRERSAKRWEEDIGERLREEV